VDDIDEADDADDESPSMSSSSICEGVGFGLGLEGVFAMLFRKSLIRIPSVARNQVNLPIFTRIVVWEKR